MTPSLVYCNAGHLGSASSYQRKRLRTSASPLFALLVDLGALICACLSKIAEKSCTHQMLLLDNIAHTHHIHMYMYTPNFCGAQFFSIDSEMSSVKTRNCAPQNIGTIQYNTDSLVCQFISVSMFNLI